MEASDAFTQGVETSEEDPFGGDAFGDFEQHDPDAPPPDGSENGTGELKTVDKEGNEVPVEVDPTSPPATPSMPSEGSSPEPTGDASPEPISPASEPSTAAAAAATPESTPASTEEPTTPGASREQIEGDVGDPTGTSSPPPPIASESGSPSSALGEDEEAPLPEEPKDKHGRATARRYVILRIDAPGKFSQVYWYEDDKGKMLTKREPGSKRQGIAVCKSPEAALKVGFAACGAPQDGVNLVATAALHFQPRIVKPMPPEPSKQRLQIS